MMMAARVGGSRKEQGASTSRLGVNRGQSTPRGGRGQSTSRRGINRGQSTPRGGDNRGNRRRAEASVRSGHGARSPSQTVSRVEASLGDAAAATWIFRRNGPRRRRVGDAAARASSEPARPARESQRVENKERRRLASTWFLHGVRNESKSGRRLHKDRHSRCVPAHAVFRRPRPRRAPTKPRCEISAKFLPQRAQRAQEGADHLYGKRRAERGTEAATTGARASRRQARA